VVSLEPRAGPCVGGTRVTVRGKRFFELHALMNQKSSNQKGGNLIVTFGRPGEGGVAVAGTFLDEGGARCLTRGGTLLDEGDVLAIAPPEPARQGATDAWWRGTGADGASASVPVWLSVTGGASYSHDEADAVIANN
ncbi:hypothetical protein T492DRAFT_850889, partial [Pavlovales sp. CCMP2436]